MGIGFFRVQSSADAEALTQQSLIKHSNVQHQVSCQTHALRKERPTSSCRIQAPVEDE